MSYDLLESLHLILNLIAAYTLLDLAFLASDQVIIFALGSYLYSSLDYLFIVLIIRQESTAKQSNTSDAFPSRRELAIMVAGLTTESRCHGTHKQQ